MTIDEISAFGRMLLNHGMYNGKQIVPEDYLADAVRNHIPEGGGPEYGYQFWLNSKADAFYASGKFGQYCVVIPEKNAFITSMALDSQDYLDLIMSEIADQL